MADEDNVYDSSIVDHLQSYPVLWDSSHEGFKRLHLRKAAVKAIAGAVRGDSDADVIFVNERIKAIKAKLTRRLKPPPTGAGAKKIQPWPLEQKLGFLRGHPAARRTVSPLVKVENISLSPVEAQERVEVEVDLDGEDDIFLGASTSSSIPRPPTLRPSFRPPSAASSDGQSSTYVSPGKRRRVDLIESALESMLLRTPRFQEAPVSARPDVNQGLCQQLLGVLVILPEAEALELRAGVHGLLTSAHRDFLNKRNKDK